MKAFIFTLTLLVAGTFSLEEYQDEIEPQIDIFPPKYKPGEVLKKTEHSDIDFALSEVLKASTILQTRNVAIGVASLQGKLVNPRFKLKDGVQPATMPPVIETGKTGLILFSKSVIGVKGVYGVMTYDIEGTDLRIAIMFSIPFNHVLYNNKYNMKVYPNTVPVDGKLVDQMYEYAGSWVPGGYEQRSEFGISLRGTMTDNRDAKLILWMDATNMDLTEGPSRYANCEYRAVALGNRCWVECDIGYCWTKEACHSIADCNGKMPCNEKCEYYEIEGPETDE